MLTTNADVNKGIDAAAMSLGIPPPSAVSDFLKTLFGKVEELSGARINPIAWDNANKIVARIKAVAGSNFMQFDDAICPIMAKYATTVWYSQMRNRQYELGAWRLTGNSALYRPDTEGYGAFNRPRGEKFAWALWACYQAVLTGVKLDNRMTAEIEYRCTTLNTYVFVPAIMEGLKGIGIDNLTPEELSKNAAGAAPLQAGFSPLVMVIAAGAVIGLALSFTKGGDA